MKSFICSLLSASCCSHNRPVHWHWPSVTRLPAVGVGGHAKAANAVITLVLEGIPSHQLVRDNPDTFLGFGIILSRENYFNTRSKWSSYW